MAVNEVDEVVSEVYKGVVSEVDEEVQEGQWRGVKLQVFQPPTWAVFGCN